MAIKEDVAHHGPRLNPFALPADTNYRFILLIFVVVSASMFIYALLYVVIPANFNNANVANQAYSTVEKAHPGDSYADLNATAEALQQYIFPSDRRQALWQLICVIIELGLAFGVFLFIPQWKIRRDHLVSLEEREEMKDVMIYLTDLCRKMELPRNPTFVWNPYDERIRGLAFGRLGRYYVMLSTGLLSTFSTDPAAFRAIVLHELAHIRNKDVGKTYFVVALYWTFMIGAVVPLLLAIMFAYILPIPFEFLQPQHFVASGVNIFWRLILLVSLVYLTRNAVLRAREVYADARASIVEGQSGVLTRVLQTFLATERKKLPWFLRVHPTLAERRLVIADLSRLFRIKFWDAFFTGAVVMMALPTITSFFYSLHIGGDGGAYVEGTYLIGGSGGLFLVSQQLSFLGTGLLLAIFLGGFFVQGVWRSALLQWESGISQRVAMQLGIGAALGIILGQVLSLQDTFSPNYIKDLPFYIVFGIFWGFLLIISLVAFLQWIITCVFAWVEIAVHRLSPRFIYWGGIIVTGGELAVVLGVFYWFWYLALENLYPITFAGFAALFSDLWSDALIAILSPYLLLASIVLWVYPLTTQLWRMRGTSTSDSHWVFLDGPSQGPAIANRASLRLGLILKVGLLGGLAFWIELFLLHFEIPFVIPKNVRDTYQFSYLTFYALLLLGMVIQGIIAVIVARQVQWFKLQQAMIAAFLVGCIATLGILGSNILAGGSLNILLFWTVFSSILSGGALVAILFTFIGTYGRITHTPALRGVQTITAERYSVETEGPQIRSAISRQASRLDIGIGIGIVLVAVVLISVGSTALIALVGGN
jgi:Zn-dependent protease with chaperone function